MNRFKLRLISLLLSGVLVLSLFSCTRKPAEENPSLSSEIDLQANSLTLPEGSAFAIKTFSAEESSFGIPTALPESSNTALNDAIQQKISSLLLAYKPVDGSLTALDIVNCKKSADRYSFAFKVFYKLPSGEQTEKLVWLSADFAAGTLLTLGEILDKSYFENGLVTAFCRTTCSEKFSGSYNAEALSAFEVSGTTYDSFYINSDGVTIVMGDAIGATVAIEVFVSNSMLAVFLQNQGGGASSGNSGNGGNGASGGSSGSGHVTQYPADYRPASVGEKVVALTFDDGPGYSSTPRLLDYLEEKGYKATFFVNGYNFSDLTNPAAQAILKRAVSLGSEVGNHSYSHPDFCSITPDQRTYQLEHNAELIENACGVYPNLFRAPGGSFPQGMPEANDYFYIYWTADGEDWKYKNDPDMDAQALADHYLKLIRSGSIVLFHDVYNKSVDAAIIIMDTLAKEGYRFVTVSELLDLRGKTPDGTIYVSQTTTRNYLSYEKNA